MTGLDVIVLAVRAFSKPNNIDSVAVVTVAEAEEQESEEEDVEEGSAADPAQGPRNEPHLRSALREDQSRQAS